MCVFLHVWPLNVSAFRQKLHLAENQDLPKTSGPWGAEDRDHTLIFSQHLTIPGCHGIDPAALVTQQEEGLFFSIWSVTPREQYRDWKQQSI